MGVLRLMIAHAVASCLAGAFAFLAVLGLRESLRALLGQGRFDRVSAAVQALLVVAAISGLLVLPAVYGNVAGRWLSQELVPVWVVPPLWFVGLHEWLAGPVIHGLPRGALSGMVAEAEREATVVYQTVGLQFNGLAALALAALAAVTLITAAACAWNSRRLPLPHYGRVANHPARLALRWLTHVVVRAPLTRAGFFFTAQTLSRSASHRIALATALAVGAAAALLVTGGQVALPPTGVSELPIGALAAQILALGAVISGLRRAMATPVELHANWTFQLCWRGGFESYLRGVRQASWVVVLVPVAFALFVWHSAGLGLPLAAAHAVIGVIVALLLVETAFLGMRRLPFAAGYTPRSAGASVASSIAVLLAAIVLALVEREVLRTATAYFAFVAVLLACWIGLGAVVASRTRSLPPMDFEERPDYATERLNLAE
jgi:hypothetical protein